MNCRPGDLTVIVNVDAHPRLSHLIGRVQKVTRPVRAWDGPAWHYKGKRHRANGLLCEAIPDRWLRPIRDTDGTDEILSLIGKPVGDEVAA